MTPTTSQRMPHSRLDRTLEYAVIRSWKELMPNSISGSIHIDYQTGADGSLDFLKIFASTIRGYWNQVCECWMRPLWSHTTGVCFCSDYHSADLARTLELVIENQDTFTKVPNKHATLYISTPTEEERREAEASTGVAPDHEGSTPMASLVGA